eukprot:TRINITY_DN13500_c0_g1_i1.p1 TRINITY_DN13500_c0_g1~~TRINITY_DN13500_c0_g1_i1.p1  ORF type:complete len:698 (+),score=183.31 TRINITY_DN13500_c0_g1_i1:82-2175(+)
MSELMERNAILDREKSTAEQQSRQLREEVNKIRAENERESRRAKNVHEQMLKLKATCDEQDAKIQERDNTVITLQQRLKHFENKIEEERRRVESLREETSDLGASKQDLEAQIARLKSVQSDLTNAKELADADLTRRTEQLRKTREEMKSLSERHEKLTKEKEFLLNQKLESERLNAALKTEMGIVQRELENQTKLAENDEKLVKELHAQMKRLNSELQRSRDRNTHQVEQVRLNDEKKEQLEKDILRHKMEEQRLRKLNYDLEKQREKSSMDVSYWRSKQNEALETIKIKEMELRDLQNKVEEEKARLKTQQALYETVRVERNSFGKQYIEAQDEIAEMARKTKIMFHQIKQLKEEISKKNREQSEENKKFSALKDEVEKERKLASVEKERHEAAQQLLTSQDAEIRNLRRTLKEAEEAQIQQKKVYDDVINERDILGTQLIRRNDELALLYEKIKIQQSTLNKGEVQYRERLEDIRLLKKKIDDLKRQLQLRNNEVASVEALKNEVYHLQRELLQEKIKVKALSEELENPLNVHRWRKLEGSDPKAYEMIQKIQTLQKRLIQKTEEVVEKDLLIQEKEKLYIELKNILARQPGPEVAEQLAIMQQQLKEKQRQMKAMASELNMLQAQVSDYKFEIERLTRELQDVKRRYYEQKRREQIARDSQRSELQNDPLLKQQQQFFSSQTRFVGGGFALTN